VIALLIKLVLFALLSVRYATAAGADATVLIPLAALALSLVPTVTRRPWPPSVDLLFCLGVAILAIRLPFAAPYAPLFFYDFFPPLVDRWQRPPDALPPISFGHAVGPYAVVLLAIPWFVHPDAVDILHAVVASVLGVFVVRLRVYRDRMHRMRDHYAEDTMTLEQRLRTARMEDEKNRHMARLDERNRISRRLHDVTGHTLSSALLQIGALEIINRDPALDPPLQKLHETLDWGMTEIRNAVHEVFADSLDIEAELQTTLDRAEGFRTKLTCMLQGHMPVQMKIDLLSVAREAITNAIKHSSGDRIDVTLIERAPIVTLDVRDNGHGPENLDVARDEEDVTRAALERSGIGFKNMADLTERHHGHLHLNRSDAWGFGVHVVFMLPGTATADKERPKP
jgi:signal transduction histidine kinase